MSSPGTGLLDISTLRANDITISIRQRDAADEGILENATGIYDTLGASIGIEDANIQSYNLSFNMGREAIQAMGTKYAKARVITFPIDVSISVDAIVGDLTTGSLSDLISNDKAYDIVVNLKKPVAPGEAQPVLLRYAIKNAKLDGQNYSNGIGDNKSVSLNWTASIGSSTASNNGLYISGITSVQ